MRRGKQAFLLLAGSVAAAVWMAAAPVKNGIRVETAVIQPGELVQTVWLNGIVGYTDEQPYVSLKTGKINSIYVQIGDTVSEGDLLFQVYQYRRQSVGHPSGHRLLWMYRSSVPKGTHQAGRKR